MAEYNISSTTTTSLNTIKDYSIASKPLDYISGEETFIYFDKAADYFGYYKTLPQLKQSVDALATWTVGKGWSTLSSADKVDLEYVSGWGEDTIDSILENMIVVKKIVGDSFAEIIRAENGRLINIKPISPERMRIVVGPTGRIIRYEHKTESGWKTLSREKVLHLCNQRIGDECHGQSIIESCSWALKAREEAMDIYRKILKRSLAMGVLYLDTDDTTKISAFMSKYKDAVEKGEVLVLPMKTAEIRDAKVSVQDFLSWIQYLENFIYQALGIPKIILGGSQEFTEASSKVGYLTFEQVYMAEQRKLEQDFWNQLQIKIKFERPVSLKEDMVSSEAANTGQVGFQPNETQVGMGGTE